MKQEKLNKKQVSSKLSSKIDNIYIEPKDFETTNESSSINDYHQIDFECEQNHYLEPVIPDSIIPKLNAENLNATSNIKKSKTKCLNNRYKKLIYVLVV